MASRKPQFGFFLTPSSHNYGELLHQALLCDQLGLDLIGIQDHPYQHRFMDSWTLLTALAVQTRQIRFFLDVANLPLRHPAVLAKSAASLDRITGGRIEYGLGAGAFWQAISALGGPDRKPNEALNALEEAVEIARLVWSGQRGVRFAGKYHSLLGANAGPTPAHEIEIWIGAVKPKMLALTGRLADGWVPSSSYVLPAQLPEMNRRINEAAVEAGRDPSAVRRIYNLMGRITTGQQAGYLDGPVEYWIEELNRLFVEGGMDSFIFAPQEPGEDQIRLFAEKVVPKLQRS